MVYFVAATVLGANAESRPCHACPTQVGPCVWRNGARVSARRLSSFAIFGLTNALGALAFLYPFLLPTLLAAGTGQAHEADAPLVLTTLVALCFGALLLEMQGQAVSAKLIALLGVLVALNALLRFLEVAVPGPGGFSPIFGLIVLTGYVYGGRFGFLMGALTIFISALVTGGIGPWLPYQMFTAGWVGLSASLCRPLIDRPGVQGTRFEVAALAAFGALWGLLYGGIMNIWFWPFVSGPAALYWQPGLSLAETLVRYAAFYRATSLVWDLPGAAGNMLLILAVGAPTLRALRRFQRRFAFNYRPLVQSADL